MKRISTTQLAKLNNIPTGELFGLLESKGYIQRVDKQWELTERGSGAGGDYLNGAHGRYIGWPENIQLKNKPAVLTATRIGAHFDLSSQKVNYIFSELGWIKKALKGWELTDQGRRMGGAQEEDAKSGIPYVRWPDTILEARALTDTVGQFKGTQESEEKPETAEPETADSSGFRDKFEARHRAADGHYVRSKAEMLIDNWLYMAEIVHAYERKLPIEEDVYCDFYIPTGKVYIEFWGLEDDPRYLARKTKKQEIYSRYGFNLIELTDKEVQNLDDVLPRLLLKHGVQAY